MAIGYERTLRQRSFSIETATHQTTPETISYNPPVPKVASVVVQENKAPAVASNDVLDKVAYAVAMAETHNCTAKGSYGVMYNNCFGIKNGNTAPCPKVGRNRMCIYEKPEDSYVAFKKIWTTWYGGGLPTRKAAARWTGNDSPDSWLKNVHFHFNNK